MSTKFTFLVYAPDYTDAEAPQRRLAVRPKHLEGARQLVAEGVIRVGGAMLSPESIQPGAEKKMVGSTMIYEAESLEAVKKIVEEDPYYVGNVWDKEKLVILPYAAATPLPGPA
ncbi:hypothetical protein CERSUDRAFT_126342 [Gelatoporia subvermispora B]|uniref:YCII-related domain-containing protein n=1 Tax=Ceriporiopsis subvermispora (strain B) TaxID=914234 RepID=M2R2Q8_CERS8|nr:hypothetical protein CERSUDRAFT_126342 [Gelatoporia subvermispora B]